MPIKYVVMDVDGTIFNNEDYYQEAFADLFRNKYSAIPRANAVNYYRDTTGLSVNQQIEQFLLKNGYKESADVIKDLTAIFFEKVHAKSFRMFPQAKKTLNFLACKRTLILFASSGSPTPILYKRFKSEKIFDFFQMILGSDVIPKSAAHIEIFARAMKISHPEFAKRAVYIGDGPTDMKIAKECGIYAVGISTTVPAEKLHESGADTVIKELNVPELRMILV